MPAWWGKTKRSGRSKDSDNNSPKASSVIISDDNINKNRGKASEVKVKSIDETILHHPLPRPSEPSNDHHVHGVGFASASSSVSSDGSSGSLDDHYHHHPDHDAFRGHGETRLSPLQRSPVRSRCNTTATSPRHARFGGLNLDSPGAKLEDGKSELHKLPLPPGSPVSPSALPTPRSPGLTENSTSKSSKWRKGRLLGRGTFGHVYLGFNSEIGQMFAIKEVKVVSDDQSSKECLKQLNQEITLLSQLSHPNIVQYYGSDLNEERLSVYLEYVSGGSIHQLLQEYGAFGETIIQNYTRQILAGLAYLHGRNTVHRDIKGANILVDPNGEIKLADFGMAKHIDASSSMQSFKRSPYWMAPEVVMHTSGCSLPVDIWSLGCTVLEMATSKPPWSQYEGVAAIFKIGNSKDAPAIPDHLSADLKSFIKLCLQREPSARPTACQLLGHPFVRNQTTVRATNVNITREAFPCTFDGSRTPTALEMHSSRTNNGPFDRDDVSRLTIPKTLINQRDNSRTITSLPVSPSSSPLRHDGAAYRNLFLSPPHPSYTSIGQNSSNYSDHSVFQLRPNSRSSLDPWLEIPQFRAQPLVKSPTRTIL